MPRPAVAPEICGAGRAQGYQPGEGGGWCGCLGFLLALVVVVTVFSFIAGLGMDLVHLFH